MIFTTLLFCYSIFISCNSFLNLSNTARNVLSVYCSRNKKGKLKRRAEGAIGCLSIATIYFLNYKDAVRKREEGGESTTNSRHVCERRGREVLKTFRDRTRLLREAKPCSIMWLRAFFSSFSLPFVFAIYPSWISPSSLYLTLPIPKFHWEKIALKFIRKSWGAMRCFAIRLPLNLPNERPLHFSRASLNERFL